MRTLPATRSGAHDLSNKSTARVQLEGFFCSVLLESGYRTGYGLDGLDQWYSAFLVRVPPDVISLQLCIPKVVGAQLKLCCV
jgi:hypothetical protein